ncbi:hypothetical protein B0H66DRAFT_542100 [Apodospora peruviana]|uniref:Secreted protein n=1 Tax=Apodospora peruviana TaxID=516989 RepID=A0AAE0IRE2_9PEZI|nr:hypothetical protein B0H66DRAFT_542100 [Apodospora peruviana]
MSFFMMSRRSSLGLGVLVNLLADSLSIIDDIPICINRVARQIEIGALTRILPSWNRGGNENRGTGTTHSRPVPNPASPANKNSVPGTSNTQSSFHS